jgi:predicted enzyme involved in methoxymalonyl-ACP biosynthesis
MVQAQLQRESARKTLSHQEFLQTLGLRVLISVLHDTKDLNMSRALELFNKTNQFNTTGARYALEQCHQQFVAGRRLYVLQAEDRFTQYGLVGAAWMHQNCIQHLVLSCRALGLGIEDAFLAYIAQRLAQDGATMILGLSQPTDANVACRQFYSRTGFVQAPGNAGLWSRPLAPPFVFPDHVALTLPEEARVLATGKQMSEGPMRQKGQVRRQSAGNSFGQTGEVTINQGQLSVAESLR